MVGASKNSSGKTIELLDHLAREVQRTLKNADADQVHDLRVASRRFGQILAVLDGTSGARGVRKMRRRVKDTIRLAGAVRDYDIAANLIAKSGAPARLQARLKQRRSEAERELVAALNDWVDRAFAEKWRARLNDLGEQDGSLAPSERQTLIHAAQRLFDRANKINGSARALHKLRIAAKKLRYTMELMPFGQGPVAPIKKLQAKLGEINDYESARRIAEEEGASRELLDRLAESQEKKIKQFRRYWKREFAGKEEGWLAILTHPRTPAPIH